ncbi:MAG: Hpt domain-containing protein [Lachnospiraceae bacterium]|nr:Hpt domain-containing protein [Lachnospiraceae bacterium]
MTVEECYNAFGGDYKQAAGRLYSDAIIKKFMIKFPSQCGYDELCKAIEEKDYKAAFAAAHTLKGVCMNLSFTALEESSSMLTEALRNGFSEEVPGLYIKVQSDYKRILDVINEIA